MPLFGKHNKNSGHHDAKHDARHGAVDPNLAPSQNTGQPGYAAGTQGGAYNDQPTGFVNNNNPTMTGDPYANAASAGANPSVPPTNHINAHSGSHSGGGMGTRLAGKAERAAGALVGSQALKEKGYQKEQEAGAFKMQSAEIAEAERLEKEALMRRERAVAHGAHPDNRNLGGQQNASTLSDVTGGRAGQPTMGSAGGAGY
ncbi:hypothetical protein BC628DRAFT_80938 [Trametes gibbosa]|nr:hypothetical protein BC628DRAFT_80938 [Trametes gibbosa]